MSLTTSLYRIYFTPNRPLSRVALVGAPGTVGRLRVVAASQVIGKDVVLLVPFQLAHCPKGYYPSQTLRNITRVSSSSSSSLEHSLRAIQWTLTNPNSFNPNPLKSEHPNSWLFYSLRGTM